MKEFGISRVAISFATEWGLVRLFSYIALAKLSYALFSLPRNTHIPNATISIINNFNSLISISYFAMITITLVTTTIFLAIFLNENFFGKKANQVRKLSSVYSKVSLLVFSLYGIPSSISLGAVFTKIPMQSHEGKKYLTLALCFFIIAFMLWVAQQFSMSFKSKMVLITEFSNKGAIPITQFKETCARRYLELLAPFARLTSLNDIEVFDSSRYIIIAEYDQLFSDWPKGQAARFQSFATALKVELGWSSIMMVSLDSVKPDSSFNADCYATTPLQRS